MDHSYSKTRSVPSKRYNSRQRMEVCRCRWHFLRLVVYLVILTAFHKNAIFSTAFVASSRPVSHLKMPYATGSPIRQHRQSPLLHTTTMTSTESSAGDATATSRRKNDIVITPHHITRQVAFDLSKRMPTPASRWRRKFRKKKIGSEVQRLAFSYDINILDLSTCTAAPIAAASSNATNMTTILNVNTVSPKAVPGEISMIHPLFEELYRRMLESFDTHFAATKAATASSITQDEMDSDLKDDLSKVTTGVILIHPIGVGIGKWFYNRLLESLYNLKSTATDGANIANPNHQLLVVAPDLLGSGTACNPINSSGKSREELDELPMLNVQDWAAQTSRLLANLEKEYPSIEKWCLVTNGGCSPIALEVAEQSIATQKVIHAQDCRSTPTVNNDNQESAFESHFFQRPVTNVILSSVPRLPFFIPLNNGRESLRERQQKVHKSYKTLCGTAGRLFWWYALRDQGKFIQKFSEKNLVANAENLGDDWTPNCVASARMYNGKSRYSAFSFLAGSLQMNGCRDSLEALRGSGVSVDIIQGRDQRRNRAKSVFWQSLQKKRKSSKQQQQQQHQEMTTTPSPPKEEEEEETFQQVLQRNGNRGEVLRVGGRISLAHEDAPGYAKALLDLLDLESS